MKRRMSAPWFSVRGVSRHYGSVAALDGVNLDFAAGEIHAVLGENGAGKSTLMHILAGFERPDAGQLRLAGQALFLPTPRAAREAGIGMVHQHFALIDALTVTENLARSFARPGEWRLDRAETVARARQLAQETGLELPSAEALVRDLPVGVRQRLEILKALAGAGRVLILDEPTAVLTPAEVQPLLAILRRLRDRGCLVLFITHKLAEVMEVADRVSILRHGKSVGTFPIGDVTPAQLAERMVGELPPPAATGPRPTGNPTPALVVRELSLRAADDGARPLDAISFTVHAGEILGIAGVDGNGQRELFDVLAGLREADSGTISVAGRELSSGPASRLEAGVGLIPPDRHREGLVLGMSVAENLLLHRRTLRRRSRFGWIDRRGVERHAQELIAAHRIRCAGAEAAVSSLSGGNQQKVIVARELAERPAVLVTVNPTRGLDLGASRAVAESLRAAAAAGGAIVLISTDLDEVLELGDVVRVLYRGRLGPALPAPIDLEKLGQEMAGVAA